MTASQAGWPPCQRGSRCFTQVVGAVFFFLATLASGHAFEAPSTEGLLREFRCGVAAHDVDGLWSGASYEDGADILAEVVFNRPLFHLLAGTAYPDVGISLNTRGHTSKIFAGLLLQWEPSGRVFFSTGIGLALHNGERDTGRPDRKSLGSRVLFRIPIEVGLALTRHHRIMVAFDHVSNAGLAQPNEGMDTLGVMYAYRF